MRLVAIIFMLLLAGCDDRSSSSGEPSPSAPMNTIAPAGMNKYAYLAADGGPHMLLPAEAAGAWSGAPSMLSVANPRSDYGRACAATANAQMAVIPVGSTSALVFGPNPPMTAWGKSVDGLIEVYYLTSWTGMQLDALVAKASAALATSSMTDPGAVLNFSEPDA